ncbi:acyl-CoA mutase large subunit family protein [Desulfovirgula thermocuniculi]|uniref:acyl-CoA mutase large subunit family protein n=1 Tax=Desulfovirgula thermocuniculi TaxID=348842 RepID=UPI0004063F86|nr:methylmalonyl-CoA mutase family protein [Desulfovirgula thermocuniculi]
MEEKKREEIKRGLEEWQKTRCQWKDRDCRFETVSGMEVKDLYTPLDLEGFDYMRDLGFPGQYPYTRGVYCNMYRGKLWTMRQFAGYGTARESNKRYKYLLEKGQTGLSVAFDMPTIMGYDSDHPRSRGEVGRCGVAVDSLQDMEILFDGIPLDKISTSFTINGPAAIIWCMYIAVGEKQGVRPEQLTGTIQNDILKEYIAQKSWIFPPEPSLRIITDIFKYAKEHVPKWNTISISGYHIREAGATAVQELAFTLADGFAYVEAGIKAGLDVDEFAPRLSFFFNAHIDFFEEIAKYRAARRIWARRMREKYGAKDPRSWMLRFHTQTAGCSLTAQQPENNIVRTAYEALAAVLGGTQSLHTNSMDEVLALPTEKAVQIALRTQQILAYETGVANVIDPLAGSYYVEYLTNKMEEEAEKYLEEIERRGGVLACIEQNYFQQEIADAAYRYQKALDTKQRILVGVNEFVNPDEKIEIEILEIDPRVEQEQIERLQKLRRERDNIRVRETLDALRRACEGTDNLIPYIMDCVKAYATEGEIIQTMKEVFGEYKEKPTF